MARQNNPPVGTGSNGVDLEIPKYIPIFKEPAVVVVPKATPLADPSTITIDFRIPQGSFGPFVWLGYYAMLCLPADPADPSGPTYPLIWADPDGGVSSDATPTTVFPPGFIGCREGDKFLYNIAIGDDNVVTSHHGWFKDQYRVLPFPIEVPAGAKGKLSITRLKCTRYAEDTTVYLYFGLFGRQRQVFPPPYDVTSCDQPVRVIAYTTGDVTVPTDTGTGQLSRPVRTPIEITNRHPTMVDGIVHTGADHLMLKLSWQQGEMMTDYIPAKVLNYLHSGRTPAPILVNAPTTLYVDYVQPLIIPGQPDFTAALDIEGGSYGW